MRPVKSLYKSFSHPRISQEYWGCELIGCDDDGNLFNGLVWFMIVGLQKSNHYVIKSIPKTKIEVEWVKTTGLL